LVPSATLRQSNCYYSSSDAAFADRYEAYAEYGRAMRGDIPLNGGWRIRPGNPRESGWVAG
jgi:cellobiose phosphorylase